MTLIEKLDTLRSFGGPTLTRGLPADKILAFAADDPRLEQAVDRALGQFECLKEEFPELLAMCDRIVCLTEGRVTAVLPREEASLETLMHYCTLREHAIIAEDGVDEQAAAASERTLDTESASTPKKGRQS